jgi:hypothetical protein
MRQKRENDPDRDRSSRNEQSRGLGSTEDVGNQESDLSRAQIEGNLGNERVRNPSDERPRSKRGNPQR